MVELAVAIFVGLVLFAAFGRKATEATQSGAASLSGWLGRGLKVLGKLLTIVGLLLGMVLGSWFARSPVTGASDPTIIIAGALIGAAIGGALGFVSFAIGNALLRHPPVVEALQPPPAAQPSLVVAAASGSTRVRSAEAAALRPAECTKCGKVNDHGSEFCDACGAPLRPRVCKDCGSVNRRDAGFCKKCGVKLQSIDSPR